MSSIGRREEMPQVPFTSMSEWLGEWPSNMKYPLLTTKQQRREQH